jgi:arginase family enzyme
MIINDGYTYITGTHKSDAADLPRTASAVRVTVPSSGSAVVLSVWMDGDDAGVPLTFLPGYNGWEPVRIRRILATGTSGDDQAGVEIVLGTAGI